jgi:hypothetical protein
MHNLGMSRDRISIDGARGTVAVSNRYLKTESPLLTFQEIVKLETLTRSRLSRDLIVRRIIRWLFIKDLSVYLSESPRIQSVVEHWQFGLWRWGCYLL